MIDLSENECINVLLDNYIGNLGYMANDIPYVIPITYFYDQESKCIISYSAEGHKIQEILLENSIKTYLCQDGSATTTKTRMIGPDGQHLLRLDKEEEYTRDTPRETLLKNLQNIKKDELNRTTKLAICHEKI